MTDTQAETTPFWRFSLKFYRQAGVSDACIALQDGCGVDVNLLLFLFWLASRRPAIVGRRSQKTRRPGARAGASSPSSRSAIRAASSKARRPSSIRPSRKRFRDKVKAVELEAETLQQEALYAFTQSGPLGKPSEPRGGGARQCRRLSSARWARAFPRRPSTSWLAHSTASPAAEPTGTAPRRVAQPAPKQRGQEWPKPRRG